MRSAETDFASSAMVRVLVRGMASLGYRPPVLPDDLAQATVPLDLKRAVVRSAIDQGGLGCLPLLGRGLHDFAMEPTHLALTAGRSAASLFVRWQRLERYIHSRHRTRIQGHGEGSATVEHVHKDPGPRPLMFEDLIVCGVLCALLEANGQESVTAQSGGVKLFPSPDADGISRLARLERTGRWTLSWQPLGQAARAADPPISWAQVAPKMWSPLACSIGDRIARRLPELSRIDHAAVDAGLSRRSLQRALAAEGLSYQLLQGEVRFRLAGWHLLRQQMPIAEVGFVCGYSDQAHLTREFNKRVGVPPARYRDLFA